MKIALIGYGKMGKAIEEIALQNGHEIVLKISSENKAQFTEVNLQQAEVAIEFTTPESAPENLKKCLKAGIPVVCGSTGWLANLKQIEKICVQQNGTLLYASNFSIGVNLFFELNSYLSGLMNNYEEYDVAIEEIHHTQKKDAPSGTAITLAEQILANISRKKNWSKNDEATTDGTETADLEIISKRIDPAHGTHKVRYTSAIDDIEIIHTAHSRQGFAAGVLKAAEFIKNKKGVFTMKDVMQQPV